MLTITPQLKENIKTWIMALRSGDYFQGRTQLENQDGFCCLGVACKALTPQEKLVLDDDKRLLGRYPAIQPAAPAWLKHIDDDFAERSGYGDTLSGLNDGGKYDFEDIADLLEMVYIDEETLKVPLWV